MKHIKLLLSVSLLLAIGTAKAQDTTFFTLRQVYDFSVGDEFHIEANDPSLCFIKRQVTERTIVNTDSIFYSYKDSIYVLKTDPMRIAFDRVKEWSEGYGDLDSVISYPGDSTTYVFNGRKFLVSHWETETFIGIDTGIVYVEIQTPINPEGYEKTVFYKGLGSYKTLWYLVGGRYQNTLVYYKKDGRSQGTPITLVLNRPLIVPIELYPNPTSSYIVIDNVTQEYDYSIHTITGKKVQEGKSWKKIDVRKLESGLYYLEIMENNKILRGKFIKE
ncbi:MAG: hypothetical protein ACI8Q1_003375 [Parvicella sp.]|jgi:hypothetical protein